MLSEKIASRSQRATREHVEHAEDAAGLRLERLGECRRVDARQRNERAEAIDDERADSEPQATLQILGLGKSAKIEVGSKLLGSGNHSCLLLTIAASPLRQCRNLDPVHAFRPDRMTVRATGELSARSRGPRYPSVFAAAGFLPDAAFLAADFFRLASSAASIFVSITVTLPPAFSTAALALALA